MRRKDSSWSKYPLYLIIFRQNLDKGIFENNKPKCNASLTFLGRLSKDTNFVPESLLLLTVQVARSEHYRCMVYEKRTVN